MIQDFIENSQRETDENSIKREEWLDKFKESLRPVETDFSDIESVDLRNLFGEPYVEKKRRLFPEEKKVGSREFFRNLMNKTKH
jgi:hypothetical protein